MANLIRSSKPGRNWTAGELLAYNITVEVMQPEAFFGPEANPSLDNLDPKILTAPAGVELESPDVSDYTTRYLHYLNHAADVRQEKVIDGFAKETLDLLGFSERNILLGSSPSPYAARPKEVERTQSDVCLLHHPNLLEDKTPIISSGAQVIAAFQFNNARRKSLGRASLLIIHDKSLHHDSPCPATDGMGDIEYRRLALQRFLSFKKLAKSHWEAISR
ncbi:hypothetical protein GGX14DRAFT_534764 [Mycena pura]|uniref:Uncharacterized protein n=1 Tax=Mycena pura TaxID=153505 RepID=A0AAD6VE96_9AGAR|nr:hypothetical protein GGX14DRAFT_534764 [Mycena pura]